MRSGGLATHGLDHANRWQWPLLLLCARKLDLHDASQRLEALESNIAGTRTHVCAHPGVHDAHVMLAGGILNAARNERHPVRRELCLKLEIP